MYEYFFLLVFSLGTILADDRNTTLQDVDYSKNCPRNLHQCQAIRTIIAGIAVLLFVTNIVTVGIWQREIIINQYRRVVARLSGNQDHSTLQNDYGD